MIRTCDPQIRNLLTIKRYQHPLGTYKLSRFRLDFSWDPPPPKYRIGVPIYRSLDSVRDKQRPLNRFLEEIRKIL